jgi:hypothetical protein
MRRIIFTVVGLFVALEPSVAGALTQPAETSITCDAVGEHTGRLYRTLFGRPTDMAGLSYWVRERRAGLSGEQVAYWMTQSDEYRAIYAGMDDGQFVHAIYRNLLGREADPEGHAYWLGLIATRGRHGVAAWITMSDEFAVTWPYLRSSMCDKAAALGLAEVVPGIAVGRSGATVTVVADRSLVSYRAVDGPLTYASRIDGDIVVNANWFTGAGSLAPVVSDGRRSGSADTIERGQIVAYRDGCGGRSGGQLDHIWMGELYGPDACVETAVSGVSLVHKGVRADRYPGIDLTYGYTNTSAAHSFIGYTATELIVVSTREMNASRLADYAISLGVIEGVMLDGGGSTQISTPTASLGTDRAVPSFAVLDSRAA